VELALGPNLETTFEMIKGMVERRKKKNDFSVETVNQRGERIHPESSDANGEKWLQFGVNPNKTCACVANGALREAFRGREGEGDGTLQARGGGASIGRTPVEEWENPCDLARN